MQTRFHQRPPAWIPLLWSLERWRWPCFAAVALLYLAGINGLWRITADGSTHVALAQSIADGRGFIDPQGLHHKLSPGLAHLLAFTHTHHVGSSTLASCAAAALMLGFAALTLVFTYRCLLLHADRPTAVLLTLLLATNALFYEAAHGLLTEMPFTAGFMLMLWGHERRLKIKRRLWLSCAMIVAGFALMAAFRSVVAVVAFAYVLAEAIRMVRRPDQRWLGAAVVLLGVAAVGGLVLLSPSVRDDALIFRDTLLRMTPAWWGGNVTKLMAEAIPEALYGQAMPAAIAWPASVIVLVAGFLLTRARLLWGVLWAVLLAQWLIFLVTPRYILPVVPLLIVGMWRLTVGTAKRFQEPFRGWCFGFALFCIVGSNLAGITDIIIEQRGPSFYESYRDGKYAATVELAAWLRHHAPPDAVVTAPFDAAAELRALARRRVVPATHAETPDYIVEAVAPTSAGLSQALFSTPERRVRSDEIPTLWMIRAAPP